MKRQILNFTIISFSIIIVLSLASVQEATANLIGGAADCCVYSTCSTGSMSCSSPCGGTKEYVMTTSGSGKQYSVKYVYTCTGSSTCEKTKASDYTCSSCSN